jgi:hypothetical protein
MRAYVGVDGYSRPQLARLGRNAPPTPARARIALLTARAACSRCATPC